MAENICRRIKWLSWDYVCVLMLFSSFEKQMHFDEELSSRSHETSKIVSSGIRGKSVSGRFSAEGIVKLNTCLRHQVLSIYLIVKISLISLIISDYSVIIYF